MKVSTKQERRQAYFEMIDSILDHLDYYPSEEYWMNKYDGQYNEQELDELRGGIGHCTIDDTTHKVITIKEYNRLKEV